MQRLSKYIPVVTVLLGLIFAARLSAQTALRWGQITDNLLAEDSVNLSDELPMDLGELHFLDDKTGFVSTHNAARVNEFETSGHGI